jgi:hypothetical protein
LDRKVSFLQCKQGRAGKHMNLVPVQFFLRELGFFDTAMVESPPQLV